LIASRFESLEV